MKRDRRLRQQASQQDECLLEHGAPLPGTAVPSRWERKREGKGVAVGRPCRTEAHGGQDPAGGEAGESGELLGEQHGVAPRQDGYPGTQLEPTSPRGGIGQADDRIRGR